jgi:hypothetical protein
MWKAFNRISEKIENVKVRSVARNFPREVPVSVKTCRLCGSFFSPVLPSSDFFSKGCAWAPFAHSLATPLVKVFMTEVKPNRIFVSGQTDFRDVVRRGIDLLLLKNIKAWKWIQADQVLPAGKQFCYMLPPPSLKNSWELLYPSRTCCNSDL